MNNEMEEKAVWLPDAEKTEFINPSGEKKETLNIALELKSSKTDLMDPGQQIVR